MLLCTCKQSSGKNGDGNNHDSENSNILRNQLPPHVYGISAEAYQGVQMRSKSQSILVSGESGAGKTETVKILMNYLATASALSSRCSGKTLPCWIPNRDLPSL